VTRDLRRYARQTNVQLTVGALLLLFIVGDGLIYHFYGTGAAVMGLLCMLGGLLPVVLIIGAVALLDGLAKLRDRE
jgi:hypothetical protein